MFDKCKNICVMVVGSTLIQSISYRPRLHQIITQSFFIKQFIFRRRVFKQVYY